MKRYIRSAIIDDTEAAKNIAWDDAKADPYNPRDYMSLKQRLTEEYGASISTDVYDEYIREYEMAAEAYVNGDVARANKRFKDFH